MNGSRERGYASEKSGCTLTADRSEEEGDVVRKKEIVLTPNNMEQSGEYDEYKKMMLFQRVFPFFLKLNY